MEVKDAPHIDLDMTSESKDAIEELVSWIIKNTNRLFLCFRQYLILFSNFL